MNKEYGQEISSTNINYTAQHNIFTVINTALIQVSRGSNCIVPNLTFVSKYSKQNTIIIVISIVPPLPAMSL